MSVVYGAVETSPRIVAATKQNTMLVEMKCITCPPSPSPCTSDYDSFTLFEAEMRHVGEFVQIKYRARTILPGGIVATVIN